MHSCFWRITDYDPVIPLSSMSADGVLAGRAQRWYKAPHGKRQGACACIHASLDLLTEPPEFNQEGSTLMTSSNPNHYSEALLLNTTLGLHFCPLATITPLSFKKSCCVVGPSDIQVRITNDQSQERIQDLFPLCIVISWSPRKTQCSQTLNRTVFYLLGKESLISRHSLAMPGRWLPAAHTHGCSLDTPLPQPAMVGPKLPGEGQTVKPGACLGLLTSTSKRNKGNTLSLPTQGNQRATGFENSLSLAKEAV